MKIHFEKFVEKLGEAGALASEMCDDRTLKRFESLCNKTEDGAYEPDERLVTIDGQEVGVPLATLMSQRRIGVKSLKLRFDVSVEVEEDGKPAIFSHYGLFRRSVDLQCEIEFSADGEVEAIELIRERLNKKLARDLGSSKNQPKVEVKNG